MDGASSRNWLCLTGAMKLDRADPAKAIPDDGKTLTKGTPIALKASPAGIRTAEP